MNLKKGDIIEIEKEKYDVFHCLGEFDKFNYETEELIGEHLEIELHKFGDPSLHATHLLKIYEENNQEVIFLKIEKNKYEEVKRISVEEIKLSP